MPLRISTTTLESYRLYRDYDFKSEKSLLDSIKGAFVQTPEMRAGSAFHQILETPDECRHEDGYAWDGHVFPADVVEPCLAVCGPGLCEVKVTKDYVVNGEPVTVVAKVDQLNLLDIVERKTKWGQFYIDSYLESYQWRYYVDILGARRVRYDVFRLSAGAKGYRLDGIESFDCWPYPNMGRDCQSLLESFVGYVNLRRLHAYLQPKAA